MLFDESYAKFEFVPEVFLPSSCDIYPSDHRNSTALNLASSNDSLKKYIRKKQKEKKLIDGVLIA